MMMMMMMLKIKSHTKFRFFGICLFFIFSGGIAWYRTPQKKLKLNSCTVHHSNQFFHIPPLSLLAKNEARLTNLIKPLIILNDVT